MKIILARIGYRILWTAQAVAFHLHLWSLGAKCVNGACAARDFGGFNWRTGTYE